MPELITVRKALEYAMEIVESELHIVCDCEYYDAEFDEKTFDRLRKIHRYLEKSIKLAEEKKRNVKN